MSVFPKRSPQGRTITLHARIGQPPQSDRIQRVTLRGVVETPSGAQTLAFERSALLTPFLRATCPPGRAPQDLRWDPLHHMLAAPSTESLDALVAAALEAEGADPRLPALAELGLRTWEPERLQAHLQALLGLQLSDHHYGHYVLAPDAEPGRYRYLLEVAREGAPARTIEDEFFVEALQVAVRASAAGPAKVVNSGPLPVDAHVVEALPGVASLPGPGAARALTLAPGSALELEVSSPRAWLVYAAGSASLPLGAVD